MSALVLGTQDRKANKVVEFVKCSVSSFALNFKSRVPFKKKGDEILRYEAHSLCIQLIQIQNTVIKLTTRTKDHPTHIQAV